VPVNQAGACTVAPLPRPEIGWTWNETLPADPDLFAARFRMGARVRLAALYASAARAVHCGSQEWAEVQPHFGAQEEGYAWVTIPEARRKGIALVPWR
jgi:hypothetical protein